jgi:hypothetical protein
MEWPVQSYFGSRQLVLCSLSQLSGTAIALKCPAQGHDECNRDVTPIIPPQPPMGSLAVMARGGAFLSSLSLSCNGLNKG